LSASPVYAFGLEFFELVARMKKQATSASNQNYAQTVQFAYDKAWMPPEEPSAASNTKASVTIASDGRVIASNIISPSGNASVDRSVQNTLDKITFVAPFPDSMKFSKPCVSI
jgi:TonB family protein